MDSRQRIAIECGERCRGGSDDHEDFKEDRRWVCICGASIVIIIINQQQQQHLHRHHFHNFPHGKPVLAHFLILTQHPPMSISSLNLRLFTVLPYQSLPPLTLITPTRFAATSRSLRPSLHLLPRSLVPFPSQPILTDTDDSHHP